MLDRHVIAQVVLPNLNGVPADAVTNTWHFRRASGSDFSVAAGQIAVALSQVYTTTATPATTTVGSYISDQFNRAANACSIKMYDDSVAPPLVPLQYTFTLPAATNATALPAEIALCGSFKAAVTPGLALERSRGRVYIGPLTAGCLAGTEIGGDQRPTTGNGGIMVAIAQAIKKLSLDINSNAHNHVVYSQTNNAMYVVQTVWVDDAFDVQRRRGCKPTS
ncbi:MAG: hypothetical protein ACOYD4_18480, partial [Solirubrobacterales bacterium]